MVALQRGRVATRAQSTYLELCHLGPGGGVGGDRGHRGRGGELGRVVVGVEDGHGQVQLVLDYNFYIYKLFICLGK